MATDFEMRSSEATTIVPDDFGHHADYSPPTSGSDQMWRRQAALEPASGSPKPYFKGVNFLPPDLIRRQTAAWDGLGGEIISLTRKSPFESDYCGQTHLLIAYEQAARDKGETILQGLPRSTLHQLSHKLTFVPAGHRFRESQDPRLLTRAVHIHIDPRAARSDADFNTHEVELAPRLFFESPILWQTALKLKAAIEGGSSTPALYAEALSVVLLHELPRVGGGRTEATRQIHGGLAGWQQLAVTEYIEANLREQISLAKLAELAKLSPYHFCRAFKQSLGIPPHRYHVSRRIERAKVLLGRPDVPVTKVALEIGFSETSSFTTAFHRLVGKTPTGYRRGLI
jgi:AraC family transcriptional regulator